MYRMSQQDRDEFLLQVFEGYKHELELMQRAGFTREEAIKMLILWKLHCIYEKM